MSPAGTAIGSWALSGSYLEACNCDAVCPCRRTGGRPGGRSTYGICTGALSWIVDEGRADQTDLAGRRVVVVFRYDDDEQGSPWDFVLYIDEDADSHQRSALEEIYLGRAGGTPLLQFPWAFKPSRLLGVHSAPIEIDRSPGRGRFRVAEEVELRVSAPADVQEPVTCIIPGHHRTGTELVCEELRSEVAPLDWNFKGRCGYEATFEYSSEDT